MILNILLWQRASLYDECIRIGSFSNLYVGEDGDFQIIYDNFPLIGCLPININTMAILI